MHYVIILRKHIKGPNHFISLLINKLCKFIIGFSKYTTLYQLMTAFILLLYQLSSVLFTGFCFMLYFRRYSLSHLEDLV